MLTKSELLLRGDIGDWFPYFGTAITSNFMFCDGRTLNTADYPLLFAKIGYRYGGSGSTFMLPDTRGRAVGHAGVPDDGLGVTLGNLGSSIGSSTVTLTHVPSHTHTQSGNHTHATLSETHTHYGGYATHVEGSDQYIGQANTSVDSYYTTWSALGTGSTGTLGPTEYTNSVTFSSATTGVTIGAPQPADGGLEHTGVTTPHENMMPWLAVAYIIKVAY